MGTKTLAIAAAFVLSLGGAALAQTPAGSGSAEGNLNNPGSVKSNAEKRDEALTGSATGPVGGAGTAGSLGTTGTGVGTGTGGPPGTGAIPGTGGTAGGPAGTNR